MIQLIKGFKDILPEDIALWQKVEKNAVEIFESFGFKEIRIPIMEKTDLFRRSIGENTDIVEKEMYTFADRNKDSLTLRPEATASVVRSYLQHKMYADKPVQKLYTIGPMFRRERPQKGRYWQFYQINAEVFGIASPLIDATLVVMLSALFKRLSLNSLSVSINSLGCPECRPGFKTALLDFLQDKEEALCENCRRRKDKNPLRVLDCKVPSCQKALKEVPVITDFICPSCKAHFETVLSVLDERKIAYVQEKQLVRGLDYYSKTIFEIKAESLGAQNAVAGGGRYDGLVSMLGKIEQPAIGFAIGFDRLVEILKENGVQGDERKCLFIAAIGESAERVAYDLSLDFSLDNICCEMDFQGKSLKAQMKLANRAGADHVIILGDKELEENAIVLRDMTTKEQGEYSLEALKNKVRSIYGS